MARELTMSEPSGALCPEVVVQGMEVGVTSLREGVEPPAVSEDAAAARVRWQ